MLAKCYHELNPVKSSVFAYLREFDYIIFNDRNPYASTLFWIKYFYHPALVLLSFLMLKALSFATVPFEINPWSYVFAILGVFGIVGISMLLSTSKARHDSVVDVLKEDIC